MKGPPSVSKAEISHLWICLVSELQARAETKCESPQELQGTPQESHTEKLLPFISCISGSLSQAHPVNLPMLPTLPTSRDTEWKHYIRAGCFHNTPSLGSKVSLLTERSFITPPFISRTFPGKIHFWLFHPCFLTSSLRTLWSCRTECQLCERHHPWY